MTASLMRTAVCKEVGTAGSLQPCTLQGRVTDSLSGTVVTGEVGYDLIMGPNFKYILMTLVVAALTSCDAETLLQANNASNEARTAFAPTVSVVEPDPAPDAIDSATCLFNRAHTLGSSALDVDKAYYACYGYNAQGAERGIWISLYDDGTVYWGGTGLGSVLPKDGLLSLATSCDYTFKEGAQIYAKIIEDHSITDLNGYITDIRMAKMINGSYEEPIDYHCTIHN